MDLHILSDLHTKANGARPAKVCADVLLLAGDIGDEGNLGVLTIAENYVKQGLPVLYVAGNHEYYGRYLKEEQVRLRQECAKNGITFMENNVVVIGGVRFIGATLWTDFCLTGEPFATFAMMTAKQEIADFTWIFEQKGVCLRPETTVKMHKVSKQFIEKTVDKPFDGPTVVLTHHGWHPYAISEKHQGLAINPAFVSDLTSTMLKGISLVVHGHTHNSSDFMIGDTRVITNPMGHTFSQAIPGTTRSKVYAENPYFDPEKVIKI